MRDELPNAELLQAKLAELELLLQAKDAEIAALRRAQAEVVIALQNRIDEQVYSLMISRDKLQHQLDTLTADLELMMRFEHSERICIRPHWKLERPLDNQLCYLLMPFSEVWSDTVWYHLQRAVKNHRHLYPLRANQQPGEVVMQDIWAGICSARVLIADLTGNNPNVTYEVGIARTLGKSVVCVSQTADPQIIPFDLLGVRIIPYEYSEPGVRKLHDDVLERLRTVVPVE